MPQYKIYCGIYICILMLAHAFFPCYLKKQLSAQLAAISFGNFSFTFLEKIKSTKLQGKTISALSDEELENSNFSREKIKYWAKTDRSHSGCQYQWYIVTI